MTAERHGDELVFLPLGGAGEIGMNLNLYGYGPPTARQWLMVDLGVTFGNRDGIPGVDVIMPDPAYIVERRDHLLGLILTHAHEDHLGAVAYLWPRLRCPVWASPFTTAVLRRKLQEVELEREVPLRPLPEGGRLEIGPFKLETIGLTHSIPEMQALAIRTPLGRVLHTGDWKLDPDPVVGSVSDEVALRALGDAGVLAMICDSTNVFEPGHSGSEGDVLDPLTELVRGCPRKAVVTCFGTNVARLHTVGEAARRTGRRVVMAGFSLKRTYAAARNCGYLLDVPEFLDDADANGLPDNKMLIVCTGGQGESNAALAKLAADTHQHLSLGAGDTIIFSARVIPGNEVPVGRLFDQLLRRDIRVIGQKQAQVHVSGHPARDELAAMYRFARPKTAVPVHGEYRHLVEHAALARSLGVETAIVNENGGMVRLAPGPAEIIATVPSGRLGLDGKRPVPLNGELVRGRMRAIYNGVAVLTVVLGARRSDPIELQMSTFGLLDEDDESIAEMVRRDVLNAIDDAQDGAYDDDEVVQELVRQAARRTFRRNVAKKPLTSVHVVRREQPPKGR